MVQKLIFDTVEYAGSEHWLLGLEIHPTGFLDASEPDVDERPTQDHRIVKRTYTFAVESPSAELGRETGFYQLRTQDGSLPSGLLVLERKCVPRFSCFPRHLRLGSDGTPRRLAFVDRSGTSSFAVERYDEELVEVDVTDTKNVFSIRLKSFPADGATESVIYFTGSDMTSIPVTVEFN